MIKEVIEFLGPDWEKYKSVFVNSLKSEIALLSSINDYLLDNTGKQLRPILCLLAVKACGKEINENTARSAAAAELLHTASLLHDDVVDEAVIRRGKPTIGSIVSSTASVLVGDYWLSTAMSLLVNYVDTAILQTFTECFNDLSKGEMFQMQKAASMDTNEEDYYKIIKYKTASLFMAAMKAGALTVGADSQQLKSIEDYAYHLGIAFQIRDDILDYSPDFVTGKPAGQDIVERKITIPLLGVMKYLSEKDVESLKKKLKRGRKGYILRYVHHNGGIEYAQKVLEEESRKACEALAVLPENEARKYLESMVMQLCNRER